MRGAWELLEGAYQPTHGRHHVGEGLRATRPIPPPGRRRAPRNAAEETPGGRPIPPPRRRRAPRAAAEERPTAPSTDQDGAVESFVSLFLAGAITPQTYVNGLRALAETPLTPQAKGSLNPARRGRGRWAAPQAKDSPSSTQHGQATPQAKDSPSSTRHGRAAPQAKDSPEPATVGVSPDSLDHWVIPARLADGRASRPPQRCRP